MTIKFKLVNGNNISVDVSISRSIRVRKSIGRKISDPKKWNHDTGRAKNDSNLNRHLRSVEDLCERIYDKLLLEKRLSRAAFTMEFNQNYGRDDSIALKDWLERVKDDSPVNSAYRTTYSCIIDKHLKNFPKISLKSVGRSYIEDFQAHLKKKDLSPSTINDYVNLILIAVNKYYEKFDIPKKTNQFHIKRLKEIPTKHLVFREADIKKLLEAKLDGKLDYARCTFYLGIVSSARFSDLWKLDESYIYDGTLKFIDKKTGTDIEIPDLTPFDIAMFEGIKEKRTKYQAKYYNTAYQNYLDWLPLMGKAVGLDREITITDKYGEKQKYKFYEKITAHSSRYSFSHINCRIKKRYTVLELKELLGHKQITTTERYLNSIL